MWRRVLQQMFRRKTLRLGERGERIAARYLRGAGYRIVATNVRIPLGHLPSGRAVIGEIDLVAYEGATLVFVEVKTRRREGLYATERAVGQHKRALLARAARRYRGLFGVAEDPFRFDVVTVLAPERGRPVVRLMRDYFRPRRPV